MPTPSVSVIIPAYRAAHTLGRAVDSVLAQTQPPAEILIVDDGSPDDVGWAVAPYGDRVRLLRKRNGGAASARNAGVEAARGDLIAFLDADDWWAADRLERQRAVLARHPEVGLLAGGYLEQDPGAGPFRQQLPPPALSNRVLRLRGRQAFAAATHVWTSTVLVRRQALGSLRFQPGLEPAEDGDLWVRLVLAGPLYLLRAPLATAVLEPRSLSRASAAACYTGLLRVARRYRGLLGGRALRRYERRILRQWASSTQEKDPTPRHRGPAWNRLAQAGGRLTSCS